MPRGQTAKRQNGRFWGHCVGEAGVFLGPGLLRAEGRPGSYTTPDSTGFGGMEVSLAC